LVSFAAAGYTRLLHTHRRASFVVLRATIDVEALSETLQLSCISKYLDVLLLASSRRASLHLWPREASSRWCCGTCDFLRLIEIHVYSYL
jgi:hypothetical protein